MWPFDRSDVTEIIETVLCVGCFLIFLVVMTEIAKFYGVIH